MRGQIRNIQPTVIVGHGPQGPIRQGGYLFIRTDDGLDRFAHKSDLVRALDADGHTLPMDDDGDVLLTESLVGLWVIFTPVLHFKGPRAVDVRLCTNTPALYEERRP